VRETGAARENVLRALRRAGPPHSPKKLTVVEGNDWWVVVSDDVKWTLNYYLPPNVDRHVVNQISRRFQVPKVWFYEPLIAPGEEEATKPS
jgi:hypothetical protein